MSTVLQSLADRAPRDVLMHDGEQALTASALRDAVSRCRDQLETLPPGAVASRLDNGLAAAVLDLALAASDRPHIALPPFFTEAQAAHAAQSAVAMALPAAAESPLDRLQWRTLEPSPRALPAGTAIVT